MIALAQISDDDIVIAYTIIITLAIVVYFIPTFIAFIRRHHYKWVIFVFNLVAGWTGILWLVAFVWAIWPKEKTFIDPFVNNPTGIGRRTTGRTIRNVRDDYYYEDEDYYDEVYARRNDDRYPVKKPIKTLPQNVWPNNSSKIAENFQNANLETKEAENNNVLINVTLIGKLKRLRAIEAISQEQFEIEREKLLSFRTNEQPQIQE